ncbi:MAG TPA: hypothetical protein PLI97_07595 [Fluviicola sp.]|nr:hypothetical protein [Fluviicola sp.]
MKTVNFSVLLFFSAYAISQQKDSINYYNQTSLSIYFGIGNYTTFPNGTNLIHKNTEHTLCFSTVNGIQFRNHFFGLEASIERWKGLLLFPMSFNYRINFIKKRLSPYVLINLGYSIGQINNAPYYKDKRSRFLLKSGFGLQIKLTNKIAITTDLTYKLQSMRSSYKRIINPYGKGLLFCDISKIEF